MKIKKSHIGIFINVWSIIFSIELSYQDYSGQDMFPY